jgi:hypothetical protein
LARSEEVSFFNLLPRDLNTFAGAAVADWNRLGRACGPEESASGDPGPTITDDKFRLSRSEGPEESATGRALLLVLPPDVSSVETILRRFDLDSSGSRRSMIAPLGPRVAPGAGCVFDPDSKIRRMARSLLPLQAITAALAAATVHESSNTDKTEAMAVSRDLSILVVQAGP